MNNRIRLARTAPILFAVRRDGRMEVPSGMFAGSDVRIASGGAAGSIASLALVDAAGARLPQSPRETEDPLDPEIRVGGAGSHAEATTFPRPIGAQSRPKPHPEIASTELDGEAVVYDPRSGQVHQLNLTATFVWSLCNGELAVEKIVETVADTYWISPAEAATDVHGLLTNLSSAGLIVDSLNRENEPVSI